MLHQKLESQRTAPERARVEPIEYMRAVRPPTPPHTHNKITHVHAHTVALPLPQLVPVCLLSQTQPLFSCLRLQMQAGGLMNRWGMLYCGGAPPVVKALQEISQEFSIQYKSESFGW